MRRPIPEVPGPGQESVWDYPRPPRAEQRGELVRIEFGGVLIAETREAWSVLETSHPPTYYLPPDAFLDGALVPAPGSSTCEWKGRARYWDVVAGGRTAAGAAWSYPDPLPAFADLRDHVAVYPAAMERCSVDGLVVRPQDGGFYGGWITDRVVGPFKGGPGTWGW